MQGKLTCTDAGADGILTGAWMDEGDTAGTLPSLTELSLSRGRLGGSGGGFTGGGIGIRSAAGKGGMGGGCANDGDVAGEPVGPSPEGPSPEGPSPAGLCCGVGDGDTRLMVECACEMMPGDMLPMPGPNKTGIKTSGSHHMTWQEPRAEQGIAKKSN